MIQELLYTSYEGEGLRKGGGGGFCTVLSTQGMATNMASTLERLSGYRHPFDIHDQRSKHNPVNYQHSVISLGGTKYHVLSRIADLRREHTGRSNKLAHHIVLPDNETLPVGGPAFMMSHPGICRVDWDNRVTLVPPIPKEALPVFDIPQDVCRTWERVTKDAGWAGVVADWLLETGKGTVHVIFPLEADTLALTNEVFQLIPPQRRWDVTFSTYYTALVPGSTCDLRFVLDGTREAEQLRRDYRQLKVDLIGELTLPHDSTRVRAARSGDAIAAARRLDDRASELESGSSILSDKLLTNSPTKAVTAPPWQDPEGDLELEPLLATPAAYHNGNGRGSNRRLPNVRESTATATNRYSLPLKLLLVCLAAVILLMVFVFGAGVALLFTGRSPDPPSVKLNPKPDSPDSTEQKRTKDEPKLRGEVGTAGVSNEPGNVEQNSKADNGEKRVESISESTGKNLELARSEGGSAKVPKTPLEPVNGAATNVQEENPTLLSLAEGIRPIPQQLTTLSWSADTLQLPVALTRELPVREQTSGRIVGLEKINVAAKPEGALGYLAIEDNTDGKCSVSISWKPSGLEGPEKQLTVTIAEMAVDKSDVMFNWTEEAFKLKAVSTNFRRDLANGLRWCEFVLELDRRQYCVPLSKPLVGPKLQLLPPDESKTRIEDDAILPTDDTWHIRCRPIGNDKILVANLHQSELESGSNGKTGKLTVSIGDREPMEKLLEASYDARRDNSNGRLSVAITALLLQPQLSDDSKPDKWFTIRDADTWNQAASYVEKLNSDSDKRVTMLESNLAQDTADLKKLNDDVSKANKNSDMSKSYKRIGELEADIPKNEALIKQWKRRQTIAGAEKDLFARLTKYPLEYEISLEASYTYEGKELFPVKILGEQ